MNLRSNSVQCMALLVISCIGVNSVSAQSTNDSTATDSPTVAAEAPAADLEEVDLVDAENNPGINLDDPTYVLSGHELQLSSGTVTDEYGVTSVVTSDTGELNKDGIDDLVVLLKLEPPGDGVFFFINVFLADGQGNWTLVGEDFLGDRILYKYIDVYGEGSFSSLTGSPIPESEYGKIVLGMYAHSQNHSLDLEPDVFTKRHWQVINGALVAADGY